MDPQVDDRTVLLIHHGELEDVAQVLRAADIAFEERPARAETTGAYLAAALAISSPNFLLERLRRGEVGDGQRMAILEGESRTLRTMLSRGGVEWLVRRPVHPASLRLLVLHCLYRGPEKRRSARVTIGAKVALRRGLRSETVVLEDLSERDCRVLSTRAADALDQRVKLRLPPEITGGRALALRGRVVRTAPAPDGEDAHEICVLFDAPSPRDLGRLRGVVARHARGPAMLQDATVRSRPPRSERRSLIAVGTRNESRAEGPGAPPHVERRGDSRRAFERRVIATDEQATRVLVGRDIALGGMRVCPTADLSIGDALKIAVHVPGHEGPLVVSADVTRDDGERGLLLQFSDLSQSAETCLEKMLGSLPALSSGGGNVSDDDAPRVVSEILARRSA